MGPGVQDEQSLNGQNGRIDLKRWLPETFHPPPQHSALTETRERGHGAWKRKRETSQDSQDRRLNPQDITRSTHDARERGECVCIEKAGRVQKRKRKKGKEKEGGNIKLVRNSPADVLLPNVATSINVFETPNARSYSYPSKLSFETHISMPSSLVS